MIDYMQDRHEAVLESSLDNDQYKIEDLISIKTPLNLPYYSSSETFERAYGSININGVEYQYVKRRAYQDTLELLCLPNKTKTDLLSAKNEFFKLSVEDQSTLPNKKQSTNLKISLPDYFQELNTVLAGPFLKPGEKYFTSNTSFLTVDYSLQQDRPPQSMQASI